MKHRQASIPSAQAPRDAGGGRHFPEQVMDAKGRQRLDACEIIVKRKIGPAKGVGVGCRGAGDHHLLPFSFSK